MSEIAPCPACGHAAGVQSHQEIAYISCSNKICGVRGPWGWREDGAIAAWNRLSAAAELVKLVRAKLADMDKNAGFELPGKFQVTITVDAGLIRATGGGG